MIENYEKFRLKDKRDVNDLFAEVNFSNNEEIKNCQVIKFTLGDKECYVDKKYLNAMLFAIGSPEEQRKMIPQKILRSRLYETLIGIIATKDIKKGEKINFKLKLTLPTFEQEAISELIPPILKKQILKVPFLKGRMEQLEKAKIR